VLCVVLAEASAGGPCKVGSAGFFAKALVALSMKLELGLRPELAELFSGAEPAASEAIGP
tara:strand:+ start:932 stop:1111 length:180 start_codon:yes stop_codon:yes gene_type:complete